MELICKHRCIIGEGPVWNEFERKLYYTNGYGDEICILDVYTGDLKVRSLTVGGAAFAFTKDGRIVISRHDGAYILNDDDTLEDLYDTSKIKIRFGNDMKVGPDGRLYVGTLSEKKAGISDKIDGKLYCIDNKRNVRILLDGLILSNGLDWSIDEKYLYHTDSGEHIIKEYAFDKESGNITFTGRQLFVDGVDGFTVDSNNRILAGCWGRGHIAVVDTVNFKIDSYIDIPARIPTSCG
jgi:sugar lactone lactonase YvrE